MSLSQASSVSRVLRLLYCSSEPRGTACSMIRVVAPLQRDPCIELRWHDDAPIRESLKWADAVIIQRNFPSSSLAKRRILRNIYSTDLPLIYETDDNLLATPESNPHHANHREGQPYLERAMRKCDALILSTGELAREFAGTKRSLVVPNLLDETLWPVVPVVQQAPRLRIGFAGSPTHQDDLALCEVALERLADRHGERIEFVFLGCITERLSQLPNSTFIEFQPDYASYAKTLGNAGIHIGIAPLRDTRFNRAKSAIKWMEMSACGIAGVYADLEPYRQVIRTGTEGLLAGSSPDQWLEALERLVVDQPLRIRIAETAQSILVKKHTLASQQGLLPKALRQMVSEIQSTRRAVPFGPIRRLISSLRI